MTQVRKTQNINLLNRLNSELKRALYHFIESAPNSGPLAVQIKTIKEALTSNDMIFTFASLVEQYAKMKKNFEIADYQTQQKNNKKLKSFIKKSADKNLSSIQANEISKILTSIDQHDSNPEIMLLLGKVLCHFSEDVSLLRSRSKVIVAKKTIITDESNIVETDVHLASKRLLTDVITISKQLIKTYPEDKFIRNILEESTQISDTKGHFFKSINLLEQSTTYLTLLIQQERCAAEEMLNNIHANIVDTIKHTAVIEKLLDSGNENIKGIQKNMLVQLLNIETKAKSIDTLDGMQNHIKDSVVLMSQIMNNYVATQTQINLNNKSTIDELNFKMNSTSNFVEKLEQKLEIAVETNLIDELTTIGNRKSYVLNINEERKIWATTNQPLTLMVLDIDKFKEVNDNFGHAVGDQVLKCLGQTLQNQMRSTDHVARYGGEEFVIILPATNLQTAFKIAQKIKIAINKLKFELRQKSKILKISCSFGIAAFTKEYGNTIDVFNHADQALYQAKNNGRDSIVISSNDEFHFLDKKTIK